MKLQLTVRKILPIYRLLAGLFLLFAVLIYCKKAPYVKEFEENQPGYEISFLQRGQYELRITYERFEPLEKITVYSPCLTDDSGRTGVELAQIEVPERAGIVAIPFTLSEGAYGLRVETDSKTGYFAQGKLQSVKLQNRDSYFVALILVCAAGLTLFLGWGDHGEKYRLPALVLGMGILSCIPLFSDFLYEGYDMKFHLARIEGMYQAMRAGSFPVRLNAVQNAGYGDLSATMYPQLFLYPAAMLRFLGVSLMLCYKVLLAGINLCSAFTAYYCAKHVCRSEKIGLWASFFYTFSSYRFIDLYMRHALGEALAMAFLPLVLWGTYEILWGDRQKWYVLVLGMTGVLQSHVLSTQLCALFMTLELVCWLAGGSKYRSWERIRSGLLAVGVTLLLNAGFLIPFLYFSGQDLQCFHIVNNMPEGHAYLTQLFSMFLSTQDFSLALGSTKGEMAISVGSVLLLGAVLFCVNQAKQRGQLHTGAVGRHCLAYGAIALFLSSWLFPWEKLLQSEILERIITPLGFAWRFLGIATVMLCVVSAIALSEAALDGTKGKTLSAVAMALVICSTCYSFDMICQQKTSLYDKMELEGVSTSDSMYMYYLSDRFESWHDLLSREEAYIRCADSSEVVFSDYEKRGTSLGVTTYNEKDAQDLLVFPLCYFDGYVIRVNGEKAETKMYADPIPMVACDLPGQTARITVTYEGLWFFHAGDGITLLTAMGLILMGIRRRKGKIFRGKTSPFAGL